MPDETDAKILTAVLLENWMRPPGRTPSYYVDEDYTARREIQKPLRE